MIAKIVDSQFQSYQLKGGQNFIQLGNWRIGAYDRCHFVFSHNSGYTSVIYRSDGTIHPGPRKDFNLWERKAEDLKGVQILNKCLEFDLVWRLAEIDNCHLSLANISYKTCMIWRVDGTKHPGPRQDFNGFLKNLKEPKIKIGEKFIQLGYWRIGDVDNNHMSIGTQTLVADIYRSDGTIHPGPRFDFRIQRELIKTIQ